MTRRSKRGFTLIEVCLAIAVMATGVLSMCVLYTLGYRENRQSTEDVAAVAFADAYLAPLVQGLSATNMKWSAWCQIGKTPANEETANYVGNGVVPENGWMNYVSALSNNTGYRVVENPRNLADNAFGEVLARVPTEYRGSRASIPNDYVYGLVVTRHGAVIQLAFRSARRVQSLMTQPIIVAEVHFQGLGDE